MARNFRLRAVSKKKASLSPRLSEPRKQTCLFLQSERACERQRESAARTPRPRLSEPRKQTCLFLQSERACERQRESAARTPRPRLSEPRKQTCLFCKVSELASDSANRQRGHRARDCYYSSPAIFSTTGRLNFSARARHLSIGAVSLSMDGVCASQPIMAEHPTSRAIPRKRSDV